MQCRKVEAGRQKNTHMAFSYLHQSFVEVNTL